MNQFKKSGMPVKGGMNIGSVGRPQGSGLTQQQMETIIKNTDDAKCIQCDCSEFVKGGKIKVVSPLMSPTGQYATMELIATRCANCGWAFDLNQYLKNESMRAKSGIKDGAAADDKEE